MEYLTDDILERATCLLPRFFDTHDLCFVLMTDFVKDYFPELHRCPGSNQEPFVKLHTDIAKRLASKDFKDIVRKHGGKHKSVNCRGKEDECQLWERIDCIESVELGYINKIGQKFFVEV